MHRYPIRTPGPDNEGFVSISYLIDQIDPLPPARAGRAHPDGDQGITLKVPDGTRHDFAFSSTDMPMAAGHRVSVLFAVGPSGAWRPLVCLNHTTGLSLRMTPIVGWAWRLGLRLRPGPRWWALAGGWTVLCLLAGAGLLRWRGTFAQQGEGALWPLLSDLGPVGALWLLGMVGLHGLRRARLLWRAMRRFEANSLDHATFMA